jgi:hypothetical protein
MRRFPPIFAAEMLVKLVVSSAFIKLVPSSADDDLLTFAAEILSKLTLLSIFRELFSIDPQTILPTSLPLRIFLDFTVFLLSVELVPSDIER